jgi:hypothetical protein
MNPILSGKDRSARTFPVLLTPISMSTHSKGKQPKSSKALVELRKLRDLWTALNDTIEEQDPEIWNDIADQYRRHPLYAKHYPEDQALAEEECGIEDHES